MTPPHLAKGLLDLHSGGLAWWKYNILIDQSTYQFGLLVLLAAFLLWFEASGLDQRLAAGELSFTAGVLNLGTLTFLSLAFGFLGAPTRFIYFQF